VTRTHQRHFSNGLLFWPGTNSQFDKPIFDMGADHFRMIFLQVVNALSVAAPL
jgi:hypothetical protein